MATNEQEEVIVDDLEETNEEVEENTEEKVEQTSKPKRTPQEEYEYHNGRAQRLAKKHGFGEKMEKAEVKSENSKPNEFTDGQLAILRADGFRKKGEIAIAQEYVNTGKSLLDVLENKHFLNDIADFRASQESADAIPKGKGRPGQTGTTDIDLAVAKFKETGVLPDDFETRVKVKNVLVEADKGVGAIFK